MRPGYDRKGVESDHGTLLIDFFLKVFRDTFLPILIEFL